MGRQVGCGPLSVVAGKPYTVPRDRRADGVYPPMPAGRVRDRDPRPFGGEGDEDSDA